jgi:hypothetical protein
MRTLLLIVRFTGIIASLYFIGTSMVFSFDTLVPLLSSGDPMILQIASSSVFWLFIIAAPFLGILFPYSMIRAQKTWNLAFGAFAIVSATFLIIVTFHPPEFLYWGGLIVLFGTQVPAIAALRLPKYRRMRTRQPTQRLPVVLLTKTHHD